MKTYVVLDLETTGLDYKTEQITEIGAIKLDSEFNEIGRFHTLVSLEESRELPEFITKLTGITVEDLIGQPSESEAFESLKEFIGDSIVVAQNAPFDLSFLWNGGIQPKEFLCTRALVRYVEPELSASLKDVTERNGIELNGHHRALNDVKATIEVMKLYLAKIDEDVYDPFNIVIDEPNRPLNFGPRYSAVRKLAHVALDMFELDCIERGEIPDYLRKRIAEVNNRMEAI
jgi:DNA polymerase-3 subunit epsilon